MHQYTSIYTANCATVREVYGSEVLMHTAAFFPRRGSWWTDQSGRCIIDILIHIWRNQFIDVYNKDAIIVNRNADHPLNLNINQIT